MNDTLKTIHSLRSIHGNFSDRNISDEDLETILDTCVRAANASARQSYSILAVSDKNKIREQFEYSGNKALLFCVDYNRIISTAEYLGHTFKSSDILSFITGSTDTILAAQTAAIAAKSLGIDSLLTNSVHRCNIKNLYKEMGLPEKQCFPLIALILGYPETEPDHVKGRLSGDGIVHYDKYKNLGDDELEALVKAYDDTGAHMGLIDNWKDNGYEHYLDWFYKSWSWETPVEKQKEIQKALINAGFIDPNLL